MPAKQRMVLFLLRLGLGGLILVGPVLTRILGRDYRIGIGVDRVFQHPPVQQPYHPVGIARHLRVVRDDDKRSAALAHAVSHELERPCAGLYVQVAGGFVGEDYLRVADQRARDAYALLFAARHLVGRVVHSVNQTHRLNHLAGAAVPDLFGHAAVCQRHCDVLQRVIRREQVVRLEHESDVTQSEVDQFVLAHALDMAAEYYYLAARGVVKSRQHVKQRTFARTRAADYRAELARHYVERHVLQRVGAACALAERLAHVHHADYRPGGFLCAF